MNINVEIGDDTVIYCTFQLITPVIAIGMTGIKGDTGSIPGSGIPVSTGAAWDTSLTATAESDFIVSGASPFAWAKKTLAQVKTILGLASNVPAATAADDVIMADTTPFAWIKKTLVELRAKIFTLGSDADGDMYYRASGVLARLAKAASGNYKLFQNVGLTAPEWAVGISSNDYTYDVSTASGNQTLTGAGFTPSAAIVFYGIDGVAGGIGLKSTTQTTLILFYSSAAAMVKGSQFINVGISGGNSTVASLTFNSDGGVLAWTKTGSPTGTLVFTVFWVR